MLRLPDASSTPHTAASFDYAMTAEGCPTDRLASEGVLSPHSEECPSNDHAVAPQRPMRNIVKIIGHPLFDFGARVGRASPAEHLSEPCNSGPHAMSGMIVADAVGKAMPVHCMRSRPDNRHASKENIQKLRQLVDAALA